MIDQKELERRHHELVVTEAWTANDDASVTDEIAGQRARLRLTTIEDEGTVWSEEEVDLIRTQSPQL